MLLRKIYPVFTQNAPVKLKGGADRQTPTLSQHRKFLRLQVLRLLMRTCQSLMQEDQEELSAGIFAQYLCYYNVGRWT